MTNLTKSKTTVMAMVQRRWLPTVLTVLVAWCAVAWLAPRPAWAQAKPPLAVGEVDAETAPTARKAASGRVNLNTATAAQLEMLPGIGPAKAERIVAYRTKHGGFRRVIDLRRVKGFGAKTLKKLERFLDVKGETTLSANP